ncbi:MAG: bi-domain-containing oxidoreductase [Nitrososphaerales archaeon]
MLVRNQFSLLSAGTERARIEVGRETLVGKARRRPDQVRKVVQAARQMGVMDTWAMVQDRLSAPGFMGYSSSGTVLQVGSSVDDILRGQLVACAGGGYANHAEIVNIPKNLCAVVPDGVAARDAAFATLGAIALRGIHQTNAVPGSRIVVIGLGLVGQLTMRLLDAYGFCAAGVDSDDAMVELARGTGLAAWGRGEDDLLSKVARHLGGGADAVIVTAAAKTSDPLDIAGQVARDRASVVIVGDTAVVPKREVYYHKELTIAYSRSYGPGRYDPVYEEGGVAYPEGFVAFDERRNLMEFLRLLAVKRIDIDSLNPVVFPVEQAADAYTELASPGTPRKIAILLQYPDRPESSDDSGTRKRGDQVPTAIRASETGQVRIASLGAGSFATRMLLPPLARDKRVGFSWIASAGGLSAKQQGKRFGFARAVSNLEEGLQQGDTDAVVVATRHDSHAALASELLARGVAVFCEKPLALSEEELEAVCAARTDSGRLAMVGFNRRFAPAVRGLRALLPRGRPMQVVYRVFAGKLPPDHWYFDPAQGGRTLGEVCHFVDTAIWLADSPPVSVTALSSDSSDPIRAQSVTALIEHANGSTSSVVYGGVTPPSAPKESIEVATDDLAARIDDFEVLKVWGPRSSSTRFRGGPKGHSEEMEAFVDALLGKAQPETDFSSSLWSTLSTLRLADSIRSGGRVEIEPVTQNLKEALFGNRHPNPS